MTTPGSTCRGKTLFLVLSILALNSCTAWPWTKTAWDIWREKCGKSLVQRSEFKAEAEARKIDLNDLVESACELSDVVAPFVRTTPAGTLTALPPADEAVAAAKRLGVLR